MADTKAKDEPGGPPMGTLNPDTVPDFGSTAGPDAKKQDFEATFTVMVRDYDPDGQEAMHAANAKAVLSKAQMVGFWPVTEAKLTGEEVGDKYVTLTYTCKVVKAGSIDPELAVLPGRVAGPEVPILA